MPPIRLAIPVVFSFTIVAIVVLAWGSVPPRELFAPEEADLAHASPDSTGVPANRPGIPGNAILPNFETGLERLPGSLKGTEIDGTLAFDASGHLIASREIRRVFDWFLSALGEEPLDVIVERLHAHFDSELPPGAAAEARALLAAYLDYRRALSAIDVPAATSGDIDLDAARRQLSAAISLRGKYLPADMSAAFFDEDDAFHRYSIERLTILRDPDLAPEQQAARLAALQATLPTTMQESVKALATYQNLEALTAGWRDRQGPAAELRQIRESVVGAAAADRLEALDAARSAWDLRIQAWLAERASTLRNAALDDPDREAQVKAMRAQRFTAEERVRVEALEHLHDGGA